MKEVKVLAWCDHCASTQQRVPATLSATAAIGASGEALTLDLCDACHENIIAPLAALLAEYGAPASATVEALPTLDQKAPRQRERSTCPVCSTTRSAAWVLAAHVWRDHIGQERPAAPSSCPDCDYVPPPGTQKPTASVGRHRSNVHGYDPLAEALALHQGAGGLLERKPA